MKFISLMDDIENDNLAHEHGLSIYVETNGQKFLIDTGASSSFLKNAETKNVDISSVDVCIITHGHYDHGGGLASFLEVNKKATVYLQKTASNDYFSHKEGGIEYIGLQQKLLNDPQIKLIDGDLKINDNFIIFKDIVDIFPRSSLNSNLFKKENGKLINDDFTHEHYILFKENGKNILFAGCAHKGIVNAIERSKEFCSHIDYAIGGFHIGNGGRIESDSYIKSLADKLLKYGGKYYTCHCTGKEGYLKLKKTMKDSLDYLKLGNTVILQ